MDTRTPAYASTSRPRSPRRKRLLGLALVPLLFAGALTAAPAHARTGAASASDPLPELTRTARPLASTAPGGPIGDLRPLVAAVGDAEVAGVGEATHNSRQFFTFRDRLFRHLVEKKGYRTFVLEANWSAGVRIDAYIRGGKGDIRRIMREEFQNSYRLWNTREYLDLFEWMRAYNQRHDRQLRFVGNDIALAGPVLFDKVTSYVRDRHPDLLPELTRLYAGQRPEGSVNESMEAYMGLPLAERRDMHRRAGAAYELLRDARPAGGGEGGGGDRAYALALQHARVIAQVARMYAFDFDDPAEDLASRRHRDEMMAENTAWWYGYTGDPVLMAGHNAHLSYEPIDPAQFPTTAGAVLRERLGGRYVSLRTTFDRGSFNAIGPDGEMGTFTVGPAPAGSNEHLLDQVPYRDFSLDLRTVGEPARGWLAEARLSRQIGTDYPPAAETPQSLARSADVLVHLHEVDAAERLPGQPPG